MLGLLIGNEKYNTTHVNDTIAFCIDIMTRHYFELVFPMTPSLFRFMFNRLKQLDDQEYTTRSGYHCVEFWSSYIALASMHGSDKYCHFFNSFVTQLCPLLIKKCRFNTKVLSQNKNDPKEKEKEKEKENEKEDQQQQKQQQKKTVPDVLCKDSDTNCVTTRVDCEIEKVDDDDTNNVEMKENDHKSEISSDSQINLILKAVVKDVVSDDSQFREAQRVRRACGHLIEHIATTETSFEKTKLCFTKYCLKIIEQYSNSSDILNREAANLAFSALLNGLTLSNSDDDDDDDDGLDAWSSVDVDVSSIVPSVYDILNKMYKFFDNNSNESLLLQRVSLWAMSRCIKLIVKYLTDLEESESESTEQNTAKMAQEQAYNHVNKIWSICIESFKLNKFDCNKGEIEKIVLLQPVNTSICDLCKTMPQSRMILSKNDIVGYITQLLDELVSKFGIFRTLETNPVIQSSIVSTMDVFDRLCKLLTDECKAIEDSMRSNSPLGLPNQLQATPMLHEYRNGEKLISSHLALICKLAPYLNGVDIDTCTDLKLYTQLWDQCGSSIWQIIDLLRCCLDRNLSPKFQKDIREKIFCMIVSDSVNSSTRMSSVVEDLRNDNNETATKMVYIFGRYLATDINVLCQLCESCPKEFAAFFTGDCTAARSSFMAMLEMLSRCLSTDKLNGLLLDADEMKNIDTASAACMHMVIRNALALIGDMLLNQACAAIRQVKSHFFESLLDRVIGFLNDGDTFDIKSNANWVIGMAVDTYPNDMKPHRDVCLSLVLIYLVSLFC